MQDLNAGRARLAASLAMLALVPIPCHPRERAEPAGNEPSLPLPAAAPLCCLHQTQHVFKSISIFNENFCAYTFFWPQCVGILPTTAFWFSLGLVLALRSC